MKTIALHCLVLFIFVIITVIYFRHKAALYPG